MLITWAEDMDTYTPPSNSAYTLNIVIHPLPSHLFQIRLFQRSEQSQVEYLLTFLIRSQQCSDLL